LLRSPTVTKKVVGVFVVRFSCAASVDTIVESFVEEGPDFVP
jgi:hypothetical protein